MRTPARKIARTAGTSLRPSARANKGISAQLSPSSKIVRCPAQSLAARKAPNLSGPNHFKSNGVAAKPTMTVMPANAKPLKKPHDAFRVRSISSYLNGDEAPLRLSILDQMRIGWHALRLCEGRGGLAQTARPS